MKILLCECIYDTNVDFLSVSHRKKTSYVPQINKKVLLGVWKLLSPDVSLKGQVTDSFVKGTALQLLHKILL